MRNDIYFDPMTVEWVMAHCDIARLGVQDDESVYVVPVHWCMSFRSTLAMNWMSSNIFIFTFMGMRPVSALV